DYYCQVWDSSGKYYIF
nr:immunoglobulin light chain junction region [Macaca mulatta]